MGNYWIPQHKWQLVQWLVGKYPNEKAKFNRMSKKQLYAIYYDMRRKYE